MKYNASRLKLGGLIATAVMTLTAAISPMSMRWLNQAQTTREALVARLAALHRVEELLVDSETGQRGYIITGKDTFLQPYHAALAALPGQLRQLETLYAGESPQQRELSATLQASVQKKLSNLADTLQVRQDNGFDPAAAVVSSGRGKQEMDNVRRLVAQMDAIETHQLGEMDKALADKSWYAMLLSLASTLISLLLLGYLAAMMVRAIRAGEASAKETQASNDKLEHNMRALEQRNGEVLALGEMSRVLQAEMSLAEALSVASMFCGRLLPGTSGAIYLFRNSANLLERGGQWGLVTGGPLSLEPTACWGLRRGQVHRCDHPTHLRCAHYAEETGSDAYRHLCLPLMAYGEMLGLLHFQYEEELGADMSTLAQTLSEQVGLSLSSAKLRQVLRDQSIRDGLTGLYNRRYMEETLVRELARARRHQYPLSVVVADLDHFKKINDTHGHPAGDAVLRAAAQQLAAMVRASDIVCRFGGEEFVLILPDCTLEAALAKAEQIRAAVRQLMVREGEHAIRVSASFGVSCSASGTSPPDQLIASADRALYEAKRAGRDRVVSAEPVALPGMPELPAPLAATERPSAEAAHPA